MADYDDQTEFADSIIDNTLDTLRDQRDDQQELAFSGVYIINPQAFKTNTTLVIGPISFGGSFTSPPNVYFSQHSAAYEPENILGSSNIQPFLVSPYVAGYKHTNGVVDGFYVGLYATSVPDNPITLHTILWKAEGYGSAYLDESTEESWTDAYDFNESDYLMDDNTDLDGENYVGDDIVIEEEE